MEIALTFRTEGLPVDDRTVRAARNGDRTALAALLQELQDPWFRFCQSLLGDLERAREATQETGLRFIQKVSMFRGESQLRTWSLGIALNVVREFRRKQRPIPESGQDLIVARMQSPASPLAAADFAEQRDSLRAVLADLPDRQREAIVFRFFEGLSVEETAQAMDCAEGTVKATVHQALRSMKLRLTARQSSL